MSSEVKSSAPEVSKLNRKELQLRIQRLREERQRKQSERIELLKTININRTSNIFVGRDSSFNFSSRPDHIRSSFVATIPNGSNKTRFVPKTGVKSIPTSIPSNGKSLAPKVINDNHIPSSNIKPKTADRILEKYAKPIVKSKIDTGLNQKKDIHITCANSKPVSKPRMSTFNSIHIKTNIKIDNKQPDIKKINEPIKKMSREAIERLSKPRTTQHLPKPFLNGKLHVTKTETKPIKVQRPPRKSAMPGPVRDKKTFDELKNVGLRRSLSTVHFKKLDANEKRKCFRRSLSVGNFKNKEIEEELPKPFPPRGYFLPVESERKKTVSFMTPLRKSTTVPPLFLNTPKPSELRKRLNDWLQKRGKSLSTFHHLKCFGLHDVDKRVENDFPDDENKENIEEFHNDSFHENIEGDEVNMAKGWREECTRISESDSVAQPTPIEIRKANVLTELTPKNGFKSTLDPLVTEALFDLHQLILEDYSWEQCAEWLRAIVKECGEGVKNVSAYWECRAALEEKRGDFIRTMDCINNALQQGAQPNHVEEYLDNLLEKFMTLNLDTNGDKNVTQTSSKKIMDSKNIFKTSLIRFAIKLQNNEEYANSFTNFNSYLEKLKEKPVYIATPVRRSSRLSTITSNSNVKKNISPNLTENFKSTPAVTKDKLNFNKTPISNHKFSVPTSSVSKSGRKHLVQLCDSLRNVENDVKQTLVFVPNKALNFNDCV